MSNSPELADEVDSKRIRNPGAQDFRNEISAVLQHTACELSRLLGKFLNAQSVRRPVPGGGSRHVAQYAIRQSAKLRRYISTDLQIPEVAPDNRCPGNWNNFVQVDANHGAAIAPNRNLTPSAWGATEIDDPKIRFENMNPILNFQKLEGRARSIAFPLGRSNIRIVELPLQPADGGTLPPFGAYHSTTKRTR